MKTYSQTLADDIRSRKRVDCSEEELENIIVQFIIRGRNGDAMHGLSELERLRNERN